MYAIITAVRLFKKFCFILIEIRLFFVTNSHKKIEKVLRFDLFLGLRLNNYAGLTISIRIS